MSKMHFNLSRLRYAAVCAVIAAASCSGGWKAEPIRDDVLYTYTLPAVKDSSVYDEALMVACIQGLLNRERPTLYVLDGSNPIPGRWLSIFSSKEGWLSGYEQVQLPDFESLLRLGLNKVKGIVIWDPAVPATLNVATLVAGVRSAVVMTPELAGKYVPLTGLKVIHDFRGQFTGKETGSPKNDAYRWAIRKYMDKGRCGIRRICEFEDPFFARKKGDIGYVVTRDWAVAGKCFVYDLSPWGDEAPKDDPGQVTGTDRETYRMLLESLRKRTAGKSFTECCGFFCFPKYSDQPGYPSAHKDVETEWENVALITPYNVYQNTVASSCYNQTVHSKAPPRRMTQGRPEKGPGPEAGKTYISIFMADYDSTTPLYDFLLSRSIWEDPARGAIPLLWGINPNLGDTCPDIMQWLYDTRTPNDWFSADASCAGYFNPTLIPEESLPLFIEHNRKYYSEWDMSISPMVLDVKDATDAVKDAFAEFSPDGYSTIVGGRLPDLSPREWKGLPMTDLINDVFNACDIRDPAEVARRMSAVIPAAEGDTPRYFIYRMVWTNPGKAVSALECLKALRPELDIEVLDAYNFFDYLRQTAVQIPIP